MSSDERRLLVVDDDDDVREAIRDALVVEDYAVDAVRDGREAIEYLRTHPPPPLILLDWNMAPMNAAEFMAEASKDPRLSPIPVVLLTASAKGPDTLTPNGFVGYLQKPCDLDALYDVVNRYRA